VTTQPEEPLDEVIVRRARVERELARLRSSLSRETGSGWKGRSWGVLLLAAAAGVALASTTLRRRRLNAGRQG
jgi:hypothetical protein